MTTYSVWCIDPDGGESLLVTGLNRLTADMLVSNLIGTYGVQVWAEED